VARRPPSEADQGLTTAISADARMRPRHPHGTIATLSALIGVKSVLFGTGRK